MNPRGLTTLQAATYVGFPSVEAFSAFAKEHQLLPMHRGRALIWDQRAIDHLLDRLAGLPDSAANSDGDREAEAEALQRLDAHQNAIRNEAAE